MITQITDCQKAATTDKTVLSQSSLTTEWMTTEQAARYLCLSVGSLRNMTSNGHIPYYKLGNRNRYLVSELRDLLSENRKGGYRGS